MGNVPLAPPIQSVELPARQCSTSSPTATSSADRTRWNELVSFSLRADTLVWREGMEQWQRADSIPELIERTPVADRRTAASATSRTWSLEATTPAPAQVVVAAVQRPAQYQQQQSLSYHSATGTDLQPSGMAIASLILGIVSVLSICGFHVGLLAGLPCSILAVVFGFIAKGKANRQEAGGRGMAVAGPIMGFIYLGLWVLLALVILVMGIVIAISK